MGRWVLRINRLRWFDMWGFWLATAAFSVFFGRFAGRFFPPRHLAWVRRKRHSRAWFAGYLSLAIACWSNARMNMGSLTLTRLCGFVVCLCGPGAWLGAYSSVCRVRRVAYVGWSRMVVGHATKEDPPRLSPRAPRDQGLEPVNRGSGATCTRRHAGATTGIQQQRAACARKGSEHVAEGAASPRHGIVTPLPTEIRWIAGPPQVRRDRAPAS